MIYASFYWGVIYFPLVEKMGEREGRSVLAQSRGEGGTG